MVVADRDRVRVADRALRGLGRGPHADAGHEPQPGQRVGRGQVGASSSRAATRRGPDRPLPVDADAGPVPVPGRDVEQPGRGGGTRIPAGAGPGAGVAVPLQQRTARPRGPRWPVTFCSRTAGTSASKTRPVRATRRPWCSRCSSASTGAGRRTRPSSCAPSRSGTRSSSQSAPGPQAVGRALAAAACRSASVAGPSGVAPPARTAAGAPVRIGSPRAAAQRPQRAGTSTGRSDRPADPWRSRPAVIAAHTSEENRTRRRPSRTPGQTRAPRRSSLPAPM